MSRVRLIRPSFFADEIMASLTDRVRLFYVGLWTLTDDAGYFEWAPPEIGAELYRYLPNGRRTKLVTDALVVLVAAGRVIHLDCIEHGIVPTIPDHRIKGGEQVFTLRRRHETRCLPQSDVGLHRTTSDYVSYPSTDSGSSPVSIDAQARPKNLRDAAADAGGFVSHIAAQKVPA